MDDIAKSTWQTYAESPDNVLIECHQLAMFEAAKAILTHQGKIGYAASE